MSKEADLIMKKKLIIVTPAYKKTVSKNELLSIQSCKKHLKDYEKVIISPKKLSSDKEFNKMWQDFGYSIIYFADKYFKSVRAHNRLMFSIDFYKEFIDYEYMLMLHLDVVIFSNTLEYWLSQNFDYIGAPWVFEGEKGLMFYNSGNGGLSLRRIKPFVDILESKNFYYKTFDTRFPDLRVYNPNEALMRLFLKYKFFKKFMPLYKYIYIGVEDRFWAAYAKFFIKDFRVASAEESLSFAFERYPEFCYEKNNFQLPFGVHAWEKYSPDFWKTTFPELFNLSGSDIKKDRKVY